VYETVLSAQMHAGVFGKRWAVSRRNENTFIERYYNPVGGWV
jgi:hypothetical protein